MVEVEKLWTEIKSMTDPVKDVMGKRITDYFATNPPKEDLIRWLKVRGRNEIETMSLIASNLVRYRNELSPDLLIAMGKQVWDEARHAKMVKQLIEVLGGKVESVEEFQFTKLHENMYGVLHSESERNKVRAFTASQYVNEGVATITMRPVIEGFRSIGIPEGVHAYQVIELDEKFHVNVGRKGIERFLKTQRDYDDAIDAAGRTLKVVTDLMNNIYRR